METNKDLYFENIYRQSYRKIFNFARRLCGNYDQAEDMTQEAFVRAYNSIDTQSSGGKVDNWLMRIVYNIFLDSKRRERRRVREISESHLEDEGMDQFSDPKLSIEDVMVRSSGDSPVMRVIETLDPQAKDLLQMAYVERLSHQEIADRIGVRVGTARSRIHRLCMQIRRRVIESQGTLKPRPFGQVAAAG